MVKRQFVMVFTRPVDNHTLNLGIVVDQLLQTHSAATACAEGHNLPPARGRVVHHGLELLLFLQIARPLLGRLDAMIGIELDIDRVT